MTHVDSDELKALVADAQRRFYAMSPEAQADMRRAQRASFIRAMTTPCEHGVLDFEQRGDCRA